MVISDLDDLRRHLQWAITVEHATIPPYQCAMLSVVDQESEAAIGYGRSFNQVWSVGGVAKMLMGQFFDCLGKQL